MLPGLRGSSFGPDLIFVTANSILYSSTPHCFPSLVYTFVSFLGIAIVAAIAGWAADRLIARGGNPVTVRKGFVVAGFIGGCTVLLGAFATSQDVAVFWNVVSLSLLGLTTANNLALDSLGMTSQFAHGYVMHALSTNIRYEADEANFIDWPRSTLFSGKEYVFVDRDWA